MTSIIVAGFGPCHLNVHSPGAFTAIGARGLLSGSVSPTIKVNMNER